jgi:hypothetical protein
MSMSRGAVNGSMFTYNPQPTISAVTPLSGGLQGGYMITITGTHLVLPATVTVANQPLLNAVSSMNDTMLVGSASPSAAAQSGSAVYNSTSYGAATSVLPFVYNAPGVISGASPTAGPLAGATTVNITVRRAGSITASDRG